MYKVNTFSKGIFNVMYPDTMSEEDICKLLNCKMTTDKCDDLILFRVNEDKSCSMNMRGIVDVKSQIVEEYEKLKEKSLRNEININIENLNTTTLDEFIQGLKKDIIYSKTN